MINALAEQRYLHFRRAGVRLMKPELLDNAVSFLLSNSHILRASSLFPLFNCIMCLTYSLELVKLQDAFQLVVVWTKFYGCDNGLIQGSFFPRLNGPYSLRATRTRYGCGVPPAHPKNSTLDCWYNRRYRDSGCAGSPTTSPSCVS